MIFKTASGVNCLGEHILNPRGELITPSSNVECKLAVLAVITCSYNLVLYKRSHAGDMPAERYASWAVEIVAMTMETMA